MISVIAIFALNLFTSILILHLLSLQFIIILNIIENGV